jgi:hypothetical protein
MSQNKITDYFCHIKTIVVKLNINVVKDFDTINEHTQKVFDRRQSSTGLDLLLNTFRLFISMTISLRVKKN